MAVFGAFVIGTLIIGTIITTGIVLGIRDFWKHQEFMSRINEKF